MFFGLAVFHFVLPIPLTLLELKPVTYNMIVPDLTFLHQFLYVTVLVATHSVYRFFTNTRNPFRNFLFENTSFFKSPSENQIWISSILGLFASFYIYFIFGASQSEASDRGFIDYVAYIFTFFNWMPVILLFPKLIGINKTVSRLKIRLVLGYFFALSIIAIASNYRTILFSGIMLSAMIYFVGLIYGYYEIKKAFSSKKILLYLVIIYIISGPLVDLGFAMVSVRGDRASTSTSDFLKQTLDLYNNKPELDRLKLLISNNIDKPNSALINWDEKYLNNYLMNRFCNLKISDECLYHAQNIGFQNREMRDDFNKQIQALLPNALLFLTNLTQEEKYEIASYSMTDKLYSISSQNPYALGSFIIGSIPGLGMAIFGYWYLVIIFILFLFVFTLFDSIVYVFGDNKILFGYFFFAFLLNIINYFNDRHVYYFEIRYIMRTYIENIFTFLVIMNIIRKVETLFKPSKKRII
jgi:hypothetical protein